MAKIPLTDIPNAPGIGQPTLLPQLPHAPGRQALDVGGEALDRTGLDRTRDLIGDARNDLRRGTDSVTRALDGTQKSLIDPGAFSAPYEGMQSVGRALQYSSGVAADFAHSMALARDANTMAQASIAMHRGFAAHAGDIAQGSIPYTDYVKDWQEKRLPEIRQQLDALPVSPRIQQRLDNDFAQFSSQATLQFGAAATQQHIASIGGNMLDAADLAMGNGKLDQAHHLLNEAVRVGAITRDQANVKWDGSLNQQRTAQALDAIRKNPAPFVDDLQRAGSSDGGGGSELFPWMTPSERTGFLAIARTQLQRQQADASDSLDRDLASGTVVNEPQIRARAELNHVPEGDIQSMVRSLAVSPPQTPQEHAAYAAALNRIDSDVSQYIPAQDPGGDQYRALAARVRETAFGADRQPALDQLTAARQNGVQPGDMTRMELLAAADRLQARGLVNAAGLDRSGNVIPGQEDQALKSTVAQMALKQQVRGIFQANPQISLPDASRALAGMLQEKIPSGAAAVNLGAGRMVPPPAIAQADH